MNKITTDDLAFLAAMRDIVNSKPETQETATNTTLLVDYLDLSPEGFKAAEEVGIAVSTDGTTLEIDLTQFRTALRLISTRHLVIEPTATVVVLRKVN